MIAWILGNKYAAIAAGAMLVLIGILSWLAFFAHHEQQIGVAKCDQKYSDDQVLQLKSQLKDERDANAKFRSDLDKIAVLGNGVPVNPVRLCWYKTLPTVPAAGKDPTPASGGTPDVVGHFDLDAIVRPKLAEYEKYIADCRRVTQSP